MTEFTNGTLKGEFFNRQSLSGALETMQKTAWDSYMAFSEVTLVPVFSSAGLSVTAASSAAPCVQSWQMCSGTDVTRPNLEPWSEAFLKGPEKSHCPFLLPPHCLSLLSIDNQQPHPKGPKKNPCP